MSTSTRTARVLFALAAMSLSGCAKLLGDFSYDPNPDAGQSGSGAGGNGSALQGDIVVLPPNGLITTEQGAKATFTIALKVKPMADVMVELQSSNEAEGAVSPTSVTFTSENYAAPQKVQVTGVDDLLEDGTQPYKIITAAALSSDPHYSGLDPIDPELKNVDDETAGFLVTPTTGLVTTEAGGEATFTVALTRAPKADVVTPLRSDNEAEGAISPRALTFTSTNWMAPQTVTVTGVNDDAADKAQMYNVVTGAAFSSDMDYDKLDPDDVMVVNQDNDTAGVTLTPGTGLITYEDENGLMASFGIALNSPPSKDVTIALSSSDDTEGTVSPAQVVFTAANWMAPQLVTVTGLNDEGADGNQPYFVVTAPAQSEDLGYANFDGPDAEVVNIDNDTPGVLVVTQAVPLTTSELGASNTFTVALASKPKGDVLLDVVSSRIQEGVVTPALLTFTDQNWQAPQIVTVTGVDDNVADGPQPYVVHVKPKPESADADYVKVLETDVSVVNIDDDSPGITVMAAPGLTTTEGGGSATFTVVLNSQPTAEVKIGLVSSITTEGTVSPATLVFTPDNYAAPQIVTIKGADDSVQDGPQPYKIITAPAVSNDPNYASIDASNVDVRNTDDDSAGLTVTAYQTLITSESGGAATFTVVLHSQPAAGSDVTISVMSNNSKEGTVAPGSLKFTRDNWRAPQTVTLKGVDDDGTADGSQPYRVVLGKVQSADANYNVIDPPDVNVINTDNDSAGITLRNQDGLTTKESGAMASFQIVLNSRPTADVTIGVSSSNVKEGTVTPASIKFTGANWGAPQTITITGVNDDMADGNQLYRVITGRATSDDPKYNMWDPADPNVTNTDDDSPGISVNFTPSTGLVTKEDGSTATFTIVLNSQPTADVTVPIRSKDTKEGTVSPSSVIFTTANWKSPRTITITGVNDDAADGAQPNTIFVDAAGSTDAKYKGLDAPDVPVTNVDNDSAGISLSPLSGDTNENGTSATFTIALNSEPKADVTIPISSSNVKEGKVSPASVTFTPVNWKSAQKITITPVDDAIADGPQPYTIDVGPSTSMDRTYLGLTAPVVELSNIDDDSAGITITAVKGKTSEGGGTATFTIKLNSQPTADVTIPLSSSDTLEGTLSVTEVVFTPGNYGSATTITVTGVDDEDEVADGDQPYSIVVGPAASTDKGYKGMTAPAIPIINVDNDSAGVTVSETEGMTNEKPGAKGFTFTVALTSKPSANVTIPITSSRPTEGKVSPASLVFTTDNWKAAQPVTVTGVNDEMADGPQSYKVQIEAATSTDKGYSGFDYPNDVSLINQDDDSAGIEVSPAAGMTSEKGGTTTFTIVLSSQPSSSVTIPLSSSRESEGTLEPDVKSVVFTKDNWNEAVTVTVVGENDEIADGPQKFTIKTGAAVSTDAGYSGMNADDVDVINLDDNDSAGIEVSVASGPTSEAGGTATFTVVLSSQPTSPVSIAIESENPAEGEPDVIKVDFTAGNWSRPQTVTVTGIDDDMLDGPQDYKILLRKPTSNDTAYAAIDPDDVELTNTDDEAAAPE